LKFDLCVCVSVCLSVCLCVCVCAIRAWRLIAARTDLRFLIFTCDLLQVRTRLSEIAESLGDRGGGDSREEEEAARLMDIDIRRRKAALEAIALVLRGRAWSLGLAREPLLAVLASLKVRIHAQLMVPRFRALDLRVGTSMSFPSKNRASRPPGAKFAEHPAIFSE
jgi:hypothetical protein